jgi:alpha,alpha-trehalase
MKIPKEDKLKSTLVATAGGFFPTMRSPDEALGELFADVQRSGIYGDGKTFADLIPRKRMEQIQKEYMLVKNDPHFNLREFLSLHFYKYSAYDTPYRTDPGATPREHIADLWTFLERKNRLDRGSLLALPNPYIVPGGRFTEQFYWDSYFIMLGLAADGKWDVIEGMVKNCAHMIRKFGFIPTANRTYFLSRSQPPVFALMVKLLASHRGRARTLVEYLPYLMMEHHFWMKGRRSLARYEHHAYARVVEMPNGIVLNRYYDNKMTPRPESLYEDTETLAAARRDPERLFLDLRAGAESGWDFSSRWFEDPHDIRTIHTTDFVPVDLNCLLYQLEATIAEAYRLVLQPLLARRFQAMAEQRARAILLYCWNKDEAFFTDYDMRARRKSNRLTLAAAFPLFVKVATSRQAAAVAHRLESDFLKPGGLITTLHNTGQQWDAPNGWAPHQWIAIQGLRNYGYHELAETIKRRWIAANVNVYKQTGKLVEKYDVTTDGKGGGGGEYPLQDGFGWTNGVLAALLDEDER